MPRACSELVGVRAVKAWRLPPLPPRMVPARGTAAIGQPRCVVDMVAAFGVPPQFCTVVHTACGVPMFCSLIPPSPRTVACRVFEECKSRV